MVEAQDASSITEPIADSASHSAWVAAAGGAALAAWVAAAPAEGAVPSPEACSERQPAYRHSSTKHAYSADQA